MGKDMRHPKRLFSLPRPLKEVVFREKVEMPISIYNRHKAKEEAKELIEEELEEASDEDNC